MEPGALGRGGAVTGVARLGVVARSAVDSGKRLVGDGAPVGGEVGGSVSILMASLFSS